jgi:hypothetical protein
MFADYTPEINKKTPDTKNARPYGALSNGECCTPQRPIETEKAHE